MGRGAPGRESVAKTELFLRPAAVRILVVVIVMPLVQAAGIDPVHFGLIVTPNFGISRQTPPVASLRVTACSVAKADNREVSNVNLWSVAVPVSVLLLGTYVPIVLLALVEHVYR